MKVEIDQSGKIEDTAKDTILCLSNGHWFAVRIDRHVKRQLQEIFRRNGQIRNFVLFTFCAALWVLIRVAKPKQKVIIDREYLGKEPIIKKILAEMFTENTMPIIDFALVGKQSHAHLIAKEIVYGKLRATKMVSAMVLWRAIKKTEVGKRLKDA